MNNFQYSIEIVGSCNLRCPSCPVGNINNRHVGKKLIKEDLFYKIIDKIDKERPVAKPLISVFDWGEPTLHPELPNFINYINSKNMTSRVSSNLNFDADFDKILAASPDEFKISLSGYFQDTYSQTHARGNIHKVLANLYKIKIAKDKHKVKTDVFVGFHLYKHNAKKDFDKMADLCNELGFIFEPIVAQLMPIEKMFSIVDRKYNNIQKEVNFNLPPINKQDEDLIKNLIYHPLKEYESWMKSSEKNTNCKKKDNKIAIRTDGSVPICCGVYGDEFIVEKNFLDKSFDQIQSLRKNYDLCGTCIKNGLHSSWQKQKNSLVSRNLTKTNKIGKVLRSFI